MMCARPTTTEKFRYVGRFAPSPTGPLHYGSLLTALASWLDARHHGGKWLLRIEDIDPLRESAKAPDQILTQLAAHGLYWDETPLFQSSRLDAYEAALNQLSSRGLTFACTCSRKQLDHVYNGTCRHLPIDPLQPHAIRFRTSDQTLSVDDPLQGPRSWDLSREVGDFIIRRKDGLFAYQLAVVVDDEYQGVTHIVRGSDLLDSTPRQIALINGLNYQQPAYMHLPVLLGEDGQKLSKQTHASPVSTKEPVKAIRQLLRMLGQTGFEDFDDLTSLLEAATLNWSRDRIPRLAGIAYHSNDFF